MVGTMSDEPLRFPEEWVRYSLPYKELSARLRRVQRQQAGSGGMRRVMSSRTMEGETRTLAETLDGEVEKIVLFFMRTKGQLSNDILDARAAQQTDMNSLKDCESFMRRYRAIAKDVLNLLHYLDTNVRALQRVLRQHDRIFDLSMHSLYFDSKPGDGSDRGQLIQLTHQEDLRALVSTIKRGLEDAHDLKRALEGGEAHNESFFRGPSLGSGDRRPSFVVIPHAVKTNSFTDVMRARSKPLSGANRSANHLADYARRSSRAPAPLTRSISEMEPLLGAIESVTLRFTPRARSMGEHLTAHSEMAMEISVRDSRVDEEEETEDALAGRPQSANSPEVLLILAGTFLFMTNLYVVAPTSAEYADLLGQTQSMSAMIIGMSPLAALVSAYVYSAWSNTDYRSPLVCSTAALVLGNLLYGAALQCSSPAMVLAGRLLTGLGAARVITRRFIVDHVALRHRGEVSRNFVTAGALGLAFGPLLSSCIARLDLRYDLTLRGLVWVRYESVTAPGWVMFVMWSAYLLLVLAYFDDPLAARRYHPLRARGSKDSYGAIEEIIAVENVPPESFPSMSSLDSGEHMERMETLFQDTRGALLPTCLELMSLEVLVVLVVYFVNRVGQELIVSSAPLLTYQLFGWSPEQSGYFMALSGSLVLPLNVLSAKVFCDSEDRRALVVLTVVCLFAGLLACAAPHVEYSPLQYSAGSMVLFGALNAIEGTIMSLLAHIVSPALANSTFNSGLLATEAGTLGRVVGDLMIYALGIDRVGTALVNALFAPYIASLLATLLCLYLFYDRLV